MMIIINKKNKIEDFQLRELETGLLLVCPETLDLKYRYELPTEEYEKMEETKLIFIKDELNFYIADVDNYI